jgi:alkane 1-monooxygenase
MEHFAMSGTFSMNDQDVSEFSSEIESKQARLGHLLAFSLPISAFVYLITGPHRWFIGIGFLGLPIALGFADAYSSPDRRPPEPARDGRFFDAVLYGLAAFQVVNIALLPHMLRTVPLVSLESALAILIIGGASGYCGLVVAHELIHRRGRTDRWLGRILLGTSLFDHFHIEHIAVHHALVATSGDPDTARFEEGFWPYLWRSTTGQVRAAWQIERKRLRSKGARSRVNMVLQNGVAHGLLLYVLIGLYMWAVGGRTAVIVFIAQGLDAIILLQAVNYFEHYGLVRTGKKIRYIDSWDSDAWWSRHAMIGLSRHADHHMESARPFQRLEFSDASPRLPYGYLGMAFLAIFRNRLCRKLLARELRERRLGPFAVLETGPGAGGGLG